MMIIIIIFFKTRVLIIDQFRYINIQPKTIDLSTRLWGITTEFVRFIPSAEVYCLRLNFNRSKFVYSFPLLQIRHNTTGSFNTSIHINNCFSSNTFFSG